jgi:hypothetical protein
LKKARLTSYLLEVTQFGRALDAKISPDRCHQNIAVDDASLRVAQATSSLHLNFVGQVSEVPGVGSLRICKFAGVSFYVRPPKQNDPLTCTEYFAAWAIPQSKKKTAKTQATPFKTQPITLKARCQQAKFKFTYPDFIQLKTESVDINVWCLNVAAGVRLDIGATYSLEREDIDTQIAKAEVELFNQKFEKKPDEDKAQKKKFLEEWPFPHLFR